MRCFQSGHWGITERVTVVTVLCVTLYRPPEPLMAPLALRYEPPGTTPERPAAMAVPHNTVMRILDSVTNSPYSLSKERE